MYMANIIEVLKKYITPYYSIILIVIFIIIFSLVAYYGYFKYYKQNNTTKDISNANRRNDGVSILFFHVEWCPHCKKAIPEWNQFVAQFDGKEVNGYTIKCVDMNCTEETSDILSSINQYNIDSYPTIKMLKEDQVIEFDSKITKYSLEEFVDKMTA